MAARGAWEYGGGRGASGRWLELGPVVGHENHEMLWLRQQSKLRECCWDWEPPWFGVSSWTPVTSSLCRLEKRPENLESFFKLVLVLKQSSMRDKISLLMHLSEMLSAIASAWRSSYMRWPARSQLVGEGHHTVWHVWVLDRLIEFFLMFSTILK